MELKPGLIILVNDIWHVITEIINNDIHCLDNDGFSHIFKRDDIEDVTAL